MTADGRLVLVATPIGNLGDLSPRACETLAQADLICCEDTRRTRQLLSHAGITGRQLISVHGDNEKERIADVLGVLAAGKVVALVTDAGTPAISDPGARLAAAAARAGVEVTVVPGPNAALAALILSGLPTDRFCFEGFLPRKGADRQRRIEQLAVEQRTVLLHETAPRLAATVAELEAACGPSRRVAVARELTKIHEEVWRGNLAEAAEHFSERPLRGEIVVVLDGAPAPAGSPDEEVRDAMARLMADGASVRDAAAEVAAELGVARRRAYELGLGTKGK